MSRPDRGRSEEDSEKKKSSKNNILLMENIRHQLRLVVFFPLFTGFQTSQVVQDFYHQQYFGAMRLQIWQYVFFIMCVHCGSTKQKYGKRKVFIFRSKPPDLRWGEIGFTETRVFPIITLPFFHNGFVCMRAHIKSPQDKGVVGEN